MKPIGTVWFKHLPEDEQEDFQKTLRAHNRSLSRLRDILKEDLKALEKAEDSPETYDAGYPFRQAQINGMRKSLRQVLNYLSFLE